MLDHVVEVETARVRSFSYWQILLKALYATIAGVVYLDGMLPESRRS